MYVFIENESFCAACSQTFGLLKNNPTQITINKIVQSMLTLLQSCTTPLICTLVAYYTFNFLPAKQHTSIANLIVSACVFLLSYMLTKAFSQVYEQVVQSLTVCVLHDLKEHNGRFIRQELRSAFDLDDKPTSTPDESYGAASTML